MDTNYNNPTHEFKLINHFAEMIDPAAVDYETGQIAHELVINNDAYYLDDTDIVCSKTQQTVANVTTNNGIINGVRLHGNEHDNKVLTMFKSLLLHVS